MEIHKNQNRHGSNGYDDWKSNNLQPLNLEPRKTPCSLPTPYSASCSPNDPIVLDILQDYDQHLYLFSLKLKYGKVTEHYRMMLLMIMSNGMTVLFISVAMYCKL